MKETNDILDKIGRRSGMTVPDGFFDNFVAKMSEELPQSTPAPVEQNTMSFWQRVRPYAYMAAMFAGIWCMMKMFSMMTGSSPDFTDINNYPGVVTALSDNAFVDEYIYPEVDEYQIIEDLYMQSADSTATFDINALSDDIFNDSI